MESSSVPESPDPIQDKFMSDYLQGKTEAEFLDDSLRAIAEKASYRFTKTIIDHWYQDSGNVDRATLEEWMIEAGVLRERTTQSKTTCLRLQGNCACREFYGEDEDPEQFECYEPTLGFFGQEEDEDVGKE
jgi:hypothetical protein